MNHNRILTFAALALAACRSAAPPPAAPVAPAPSSVAVVQVAGRGPSDALLKRWIVPNGGEALAYADLGAFFGTSLVQGLLTSGLQFTRESLPEQAAECIRDFTSSVREVAAWAKTKQGFVVVTYDSKALKTPLGTCIEQLGGPSPVRLTGAEQAYDFGGEVFAVLPDTVVFGTRALVETSVAGGKASKWPKALALKPEQQLVFFGTESGKFDIQGSLSVTNEHFIAQTDITFTDAAMAEEAAAFVAPAQLQQKLLQASPKTQPLAKLVADSWHVKRQGSKVSFDFTLEGDQQSIAYNLGMVSAVGVYSVRRYLVQAKMAEARQAIGRIAKDMTAYVDGVEPMEDLTSSRKKKTQEKPRKLLTLPPVPSDFELVRGKTYQSSSADWAKWGKIHFEFAGPQRYQYRVEAAKDGLTARVIAEGDLDGNGIKSQFSLGMALDPKTHDVVIDPDIAVDNPEE